MPLLVVGPITVPLANADQNVTYEPIGGEIVRMLDGSARTTVRGYKRTWASLSCVIQDDTTAAAFVAVLTSTTQPVACSGDLLGGALNCITQLVSNTAVNVRGALWRRVVFTLVEV